MPNATIYYFSATGNSLVVARSIAQKLGDTALIPLARRDAQNPSPGTPVIGLVFPVYVWGVPLIVTRFIKELRVPRNSYLFAVAVNGGLAAGTLKKAKGLFAGLGMDLTAGFAVTMVDNYTPLGGAIPVKKQNVRFEKAAAKIEEICVSIRKRERTIYRGLPVVNWLLCWIHRGWVSGAPNHDRKLGADENCNKCGICEKVCPVKNIKMVEMRPAWQHHCEQCFACLHWCPAEAVQYGKSTTGRARYHHPDVTVRDIIIGEKMHPMPQ